MKKFASDLVGKNVVATDGTIIGEVDNLVIDLDTGSIRNFLVQPVGTVEASFKKDQKGRYIIPFISIKSGKDVFLVESGKTRTVQ
ncbi:MAG: PRC-barrel domain-containing protein [Thermoplasmataceae archaeon]